MISKVILMSSLALFAPILSLSPSALANADADETLRSALEAEGHPNAGTRAMMVGDAIVNGESYALLAHLSDHFGPRMMGTPGHGLSLDYLEQRLQELGIETERQPFEHPGWVRGEDTATLISGPTAPRRLRAVALGYVGPTDGPVEAELVYVPGGKLEELDPEAIRGRILLTSPGVRYRSEDLQGFAEEHDLQGVLMINRVGGGQVLARTASLQGVAAPVPIFSITQEEGFWMQRLLEAGETVRVRLEVTSENRAMTSTNLIARLPGTTGQRVLLGGHFDSWDLGQGSIDNGLGVVQVFEVARLLRQFSPDNLHTLEFIWFDAEEFGLWGSRHYADAVDLLDVRVMVNLDMVGDPVGGNAMGFDSLLPQLESHAEHLGAWKFPRAVANKTWMGSDHHPFIMKGVPSITYNAPINPDSVRYYHDFGDTLDKIDPATLAKANGIVAMLLYQLANDPSPQYPHLSTEETADLFREAGLELRLRSAGEWHFH